MRQPCLLARSAGPVGPSYRPVASLSRYSRYTVHSNSVCGNESRVVIKIRSSPPRRKDTVCGKAILAVDDTRETNKM